MLKRLDLVTAGAGARETGTAAAAVERNTGAVAAAAARETGAAAAAAAREIAGAVAQAEGGTMRLNPSVKLEDIIIWVDCYWLLLLCFNITIKNILNCYLLIFVYLPLNGVPLNGVPLNGVPLNGIQTHGVHQTVGEIADTIYNEHRPKRGIGYGKQFAARRHDLIERYKQLSHHRQSRNHHEPVKPGAVLSVGKWRKPAAHGGIVELHNCGVHVINCK
jgi:hypothetical protein